MALTAGEVQKIAHLARLGIEEKDVPHYAQDLSSLLDLVAQMNTLDTETVAPLSHPLEQHQRLRADAVSEINQRDKFQAIAPQVEEGLYLVPKVIE
jgi:aspartyl-tRNA(Asn)/glutamyl-tRNA(Gln) amidotransferase subunit C